MQSSALLPGRVLQIRALEESMERQQNFEKPGGQECGGESSNGSNLDIASAGAGKIWSESSLDSGDGSSLSGLSCTPQSSTESPQVTKDACATDFVDTRAVDLLAYSCAHAQVTKDVATFKFTILDMSEEELGQERKRKRPKPILRQPVHEPCYPPSSPTLVEQVSAHEPLTA